MWFLAMGLLFDYCWLDATIFARHILLRHDCQVVFEEQRVLSLSERSVSLAYQFARRERSSRKWWYMWSGARWSSSGVAASCSCSCMVPVYVSRWGDREDTTECVGEEPRREYGA